jgi:hypothetical protein
MLALIPLAGVLSLAVDYGRAQLVKSELQAAADAAARYAATGVADGTAVAKAQAVAAENFADNRSITALSSDVELGRWDTASGSFVANGTPTDAVRVTLRRTQARGTAVPLVFGSLVGRGSVDVVARSVAMAAGSGPAVPYDVIGLDSVNMSGGARVSKRAGESGNVAVASNGNWNLSGGARVNGNAYHRANAPNAGNVAGSRVSMAADLTFSVASLPASYVNHGNLNLGGNNTLTLSSGDHYFTSLSVGGNANLLINSTTGPVRLYVNGGVNVSGNGDIGNGNPANNCEIYVVSSAGVDVSGSGTVTASIYAPSSPMNVTGNGYVLGPVVAKSINVTGSGDIDTTDQLSPTALGGGTTTIATVN